MLKNMDELMTLDLPNDHIAAVHVCACNPRGIEHYPNDWSVFFFLQHLEYLKFDSPLTGDLIIVPILPWAIPPLFPHRLPKVRLVPTASLIPGQWF